MHKTSRNAKKKGFVFIAATVEDCDCLSPCPAKVIVVLAALLHRWTKTKTHTHAHTLTIDTHSSTSTHTYTQGRVLDIFGTCSSKNVITELYRTWNLETTLITEKKNMENQCENKGYTLTSLTPPILTFTENENHVHTHWNTFLLLFTCVRWKLPKRGSGEEEKWPIDKCGCPPGCRPANCPVSVFRSGTLDEFPEISSALAPF